MKGRLLLPTTLLRWIARTVARLGVLGMLGIPWYSSTQAQVPAAINYQGRLTDALGNALTNGYYIVDFKLWDDPVKTGAADYIWGRSFPLHVVTGGLFNLLLTDDGGLVGNPRTNDITAAFSGPNRYLGLTIIANPQGNVTSPVEISPRQRLVSAPYALQAQTANQVMPGSIVTTSLQDGSVTTPVLADQAVTADKLAPGSVSSLALNIDGTVYMNGNALQLRNQPTGEHDNSDYLAWATDSSVDGSRLYGWSGGILGSTSGGPKAVLAWREYGAVGIGTTTPRYGLLEVDGGITYTNTKPYSYLNGDPISGFNPGHNGDDQAPRTYSIYAIGRIAADEFNAYSDARIKRVMGRSVGADDLNTLLKLEITDYTLLDTVSKGDRPYKKVIGQQIESVFPQAVSRTGGIVPDIYRRTEARDGWIQMTELTKAQLKVGDRVKLITDQSSDLHEVMETSADGFRVKEKLDGPVFIYGREVSDFRVVDYEAIAMLNVSATQEIYRRLRDSERELSDMKRQEASLADRLSALESRNDELTARFAKWERHWWELINEPRQAGLRDPE
ncbi:MAG TPA: hypothetical protein PLX89_05990 [Verrucomicrobiota bacterium]|nr:hypothetical protein [Verrucomicrobiota bacterium]